MSAVATAHAGTIAGVAGEIVAQQFSFWYGETQALHDIALTIKPRAVTALSRGPTP